MSGTNYIKTFINYCQYEKTLSPKTIKAYTIDLHQFGEFLRKLSYEKTLLEIDKTILRQYIQHLQIEYKIKSVKRKVATLKTFFNFLMYEDLIVVSPFSKLRLRLKEPFLLPSVLNSNEIKQILTSANNQFITSNANDKYRYYSALRDKVVIELLFNTGLRVSEASNLKPEDVCFHTSYITVNGKGLKQRQIYIVSQQLMEKMNELSSYYDLKLEKRSWFFINKIENRFSEQSIRNIVKKHSVMLEKNITPHMFRHTFATTLLEEGVDILYIQHLLGHHSVVVTQIYTHVNREKQKEILMKKLPIDRFSIVNEG